MIEREQEWGYCVEETENPASFHGSFPNWKEAAVAAGKAVKDLGRKKVYVGEKCTWSPCVDIDYLLEWFADDFDLATGNGEPLIGGYWPTLDDRDLLDELEDEVNEAIKDKLRKFGLEFPITYYDNISEVGNIVRGWKGEKRWVYLMTPGETTGPSST